MTDLLADLLLLALMMLALYGVGRALRRLVPLSFWSPAADLAFAFAFGLGAISTLLFALSLVGWLRPAAGWAVLGAGAVLALLQHRAWREDGRALWGAVRRAAAAPWFVRLAVLIGLAFVLTSLVADLAPPTEGDTVHQYLLVPRYWVEAGRYVQPPHIWAATLPGNLMMISAWALLLNGSFSLAALITGFGMSLLFGLGVYALARLVAGHEAALLAVIAALTMPDAGYLAQSAKVDMGWAFLETLALAAFFRWIMLTTGEEREPQAARSERWLVLAGLCLGLAAGAKNQTWISVMLLGLWIVLRLARRRDWPTLLRAGGLFGLAVLAGALPYYLYNGIVHGNPFYPVFADVFHGLFGAAASPRSELGTEVFYPWTVGGYFRNLWHASLGHTQPGFYLGFIAGPLFLLTVPIGIMLGLLRGERLVWRMLGYTFVFSIVWFLVKQAARHFLPGLVLLSVIAGLVLWRLSRRPTMPRRVVLIAALLVLGWNLISMWGVLYWNSAYRVALGLETRTAYLQRWHDRVIEPTFPDWETITVLNTQVGPGGRVLAEHAGSPLYIAPDLISGNWGDREQLDAIRDPAALLGRLERQGIDYILVFNADPDDRVLYTDPAFLAAHTTLVYDGPRTRLYRIIWPERD